MIILIKLIIAHIIGDFLLQPNSLVKEKEEIMYAAIDNNNLSIEYGVNEILEAIKIIDEERERIRKNS